MTERNGGTSADSQATYGARASAQPGAGAGGVHWRGWWRRLIWTIRAAEWWDYKTPLALAVAYALAWRQHVPFDALCPPLLLLIGAGISAGVFASVFNDLLDLREDRQAGKHTGIMTLSRRGKFLALAFIETLMLGEAALLRHTPHSLACFLTIWANYTFYSLPPIRLKERGVWGVLCIAIGEHLLASLLAVALVCETTGCAVPRLWLAAVIVWSISLGMRSILWHQLCDYENDRKTGTATFGSRYDFNSLRHLGERYIFSVECAAFLLLLVLTHASLAWKLLAAYAVLEWLRYRFMAANIIVVAPQYNFRFAMLEYYQLFFPLAILCTAARQDARAYVMAALQLALFPLPAWLCLSHVGHLLRWRLWPFLITREELPSHSA